MKQRFISFIKMLFCRHDFKHVAFHKSCQISLWHCHKCGLYYVHHYSVGIGYKRVNIDEYGDVWQNKFEGIALRRGV